MAQTHIDDSHLIDFMEELVRRSNDLRGKTIIASGGPDEQSLAHWKTDGVSVTQLPDDPQGILRISIGGGENVSVPLNYLTFRGDHGKCVDLLRLALKALENPDN